MKQNYISDAELEGKQEVPQLSYGQMKVLHERMKSARDEKYLEQSKKRLEKIISTKMRTVFIGALAAFEKEFGFLWGEGKEEGETTEQEDQMYDLWENARTSVLDNGNKQLRALLNEVDNHVVKWSRYTMTMKVKEQ